MTVRKYFLCVIHKTREVVLICQITGRYKMYNTNIAVFNDGIF